MALHDMNLMNYGWSSIDATSMSFAGGAGGTTDEQGEAGGT
jgi:hypothetical protein